MAPNLDNEMTEAEKREFIKAIEEAYNATAPAHVVFAAIEPLIDAYAERPRYGVLPPVRRGWTEEEYQKFKSSWEAANRPS